MKIKKSYKICGYRIKIKIIDTADFAGLYDSTKDTIYISSNQSTNEMEKTLYHECIHVLQYKPGIQQAVSRELLEVMAETGSQMIFDLIKQK